MVIRILVWVMLIIGVLFEGYQVIDFMRTKKEGALEEVSFWKTGLVGVFTEFLDTLGIGSFAILTTIFKNFKLVHDQKICGTLNTATTLPVIVESLFFITVVKVDTVTMVTMIVASVVGSAVGGRFVSRFSEHKMQLAMGIALLAVATIVLAGQFHLFPVGGEAMGLAGTKLWIAIVGMFVFGSLQAVGIGLYAPCMGMVFALGMNPIAAFPIMMTASGLMQPFAAFQFMQKKAYDVKASASIAILGCIGVVVAATIVKSLPVYALKWLVVAVVLFTSYTMFRSYRGRIKLMELEGYPL